MKELQGYTVTEEWKIFSPTWRELKYRINHGGYCIVNIRKKNFRVNRLVALLFIGPCRHGYQVNHIDGNKLNNHRTNVEYLSKSKNQLHRRHTLWKNGSTSSLAVSAKKGEELITFSSINSAHKCLRISYTCIKQCCEGIRKTAWWYTFSYYEPHICNSDNPNDGHQ